MIFIKKGEEEWGWGVSINFTQKKMAIKSQKKRDIPSGFHYNNLFINF